MSDLIKEGGSAFSLGDNVDGLILKSEVSPVEELRNAFEGGLNIDATEQSSGNANQWDKLYASCTNGKECSSCKYLKEHEHKFKGGEPTLEFSLGDNVDGLILKSDVSPVEELRNAFEGGLNIDATEQSSGNANQWDKLYASCPNGKECSSCKFLKEHEHKRSCRGLKTVDITSNDECSPIEHGKSALDSGELKLCKALIKCASFPCSAEPPVSSQNVSNEDSNKAEIEIPSDKQRLELKNRFYGRTFSLPSSVQLMSAMRGGQERSGLGPRPKLSVKWAPDVQEPQQSSVSHTVKNSRQYHSKRKDKKHKHRGKSSHTSESSKNSKKRQSKRIYSSESIHSRLQLPAYGNSILLDAWASRNSRSSVLLPVKTQLMGLGAPIFEIQTGPEDLSINMNSKNFCDQGESDVFVKSLPEVDFLSQGIKCASSFKYNIQGKSLSCTEAA